MDDWLGWLNGRGVCIFVEVRTGSLDRVRYDGNGNGMEAWKTNG